MQKEEYSGSIWKPYSHIILNMCSTHQSYGLNIDLKLYNAYLGKLSTQFSISNSTLTQLLCRRAGAVSTPADILHWGRLQGLASSLLQDGVKGQMRSEAGQQILASPGLWALQPAVGQHSCCPIPGHRLMTGSALFRTPGWTSHTPGLTSFQHCSEHRAGLLTATASVPLSPGQWSQLQIAAAHLGGCDLYPDFSGALFMPGMII